MDRASDALCRNRIRGIEPGADGDDRITQRLVCTDVVEE